MVLHHEHLYRDLADPIALFKGNVPTELASYWSYTQSDVTAAHKEATATYSQLMADTQPMVAAQVLAAYSFSNTKRMLDLGGGTGAFLRAVNARYEHIEATVYDLPAVIESAVKNNRSDVNLHHESGKADSSNNKNSVQFIAGNFFNDPLPDGYDTISVVRILHDHNTDAVTALLKKIYLSLPPDGTLLIAEPMANTRRAERVGAVYFNCYFLAMNQGEPRSIQTLERMLQEAGFSKIDHHPTTLPLVCSVMTATK